MGSLETLGTSGIPLVAAFFIGLLMTFTPCPLATNITAIAFISRKIGDSRHTLLVGTLYALGRMAAYIGLTALIVYAGLNIQSISFFLQEYGEKLIGPFLVIMGILMLEVVDIPLPRWSRLAAEDRDSTLVKKDISGDSCWESSLPWPSARSLQSCSSACSSRLH